MFPIKELKEYMNFCLEKIHNCIDDFTYLFPSDSSINEIYHPIENDISWATGFWTGMIWIAYEVTGIEKYRQVAEIHVEDFYKRIKNKIGVDHHDMGFLYTLSCVAAYKITGNEIAKKAALLAADNLCDRYVANGRFIKAWGGMDSICENRLIIDCLLNIPLLFWAYEVDGDYKYLEVAVNHLDTTIRTAIRDDWTTFHTYFFDVETGAPVRGETAQGYSNDSMWARGQAWGIYGLALAYRYTKRNDILHVQKMLSNKFVERLPVDNVPCWDMVFTDTKTQKDTSASPIAICGMLEMNKLAPNSKYIDVWNNKSKDMICALGDRFTTINNPESNGILAHGVYNIPKNEGVDECTIWGDYFYMEALMRLINPKWKAYW